MRLLVFNFLSTNVDMVFLKYIMDELLKEI